MSRSASRRMVVLTEGHLDLWRAKTAVSVIRYCSSEVACVLDRSRAGEDLQSIVGVGRDIPILASLEEALKLKPNILLIGIAPVGGALPPAWRNIIKAALISGLDIVSGLHLMLNEDPEFASLAKKHKRTISDVRKVPADLTCSSNIAKATKCHRVLTVGTDCNLGKMSVSLECTAEAKRRGWDAEFVATGQTGIMIAGSGIAVDHVLSDYVNGAAERLVLERAQREILFIEGQGGIGHPAYSAVTLGLLHGSAPDAMILCHHAGRKVTHSVETAIPPLPFLINLYEDLAGLVCRSKVLGVGVNTFGMTDKAARKVVEKIQDETGLPTTDVYRFGAQNLVDAIERYFRRSKKGTKK